MASVAALARPGEPLTAQAPLLADRARLWRMLSVVHAQRGAQAAFELPLMVDLDGRLVSGRLLAVAPDELALTRGLPLRARVAEPAWADGAREVSDELVPDLAAQPWLVELAAAAREAEAPAEVPALADDAGLDCLFAWILRRRAELEADAQALGTLGNARVIPAADGGLRCARELLDSVERGFTLPEDLDLDAWRAAPRVPEAVRAWFRRVYDLERGRRRQLTAILVDAHRDAVAREDGAHSASLLGVLARLWPAPAPGDAEQAEVFEWAVRNHKLRRLRVETEGGAFEQVAKLLTPTAEERELLARFVDGPLAPFTSARYGEPETLGLLRRLGAARGLDGKRLGALLRDGDGLLEGADATLALARYVAGLAGEDAELSRALRLDKSAWIPDGRGARRSPGELYWPDPEVETLIGSDRSLFPHPELFHTVPESISEQLPFRRSGDARLGHVLAELARRQEVGAPATTLVWLDRQLEAGAIERGPVRAAFEGTPLLYDDGGVLRRPAELIVEPGEPWIGTSRRPWSDGAAYVHLARALRVPARVGPAEVAAWVASIGEALDVSDGAELLARDPELGPRLGRCLTLMAEREASPFREMLLVVEGGDGPALVRVTDPRLALPSPSQLVAVARGQGVPVVMPEVPPGSAGRAVLAWLRRCGVVELGALWSPDALPERLPGDVTPAHAVKAGALAGRLGGAVSVRVVEALERTGRLAGTPVRFAVDVAFDAARQRVVVTIRGLDDLDGARAAMEAAEPPRPAPEVPPLRLPEPAPARRPPPTRPPEEPAVSPASRESLWSRVTSWFGDDEEPAAEARPESDPAAEQPERPVSFSDHSRWFEPKEAIDSQLRDGRAWLQDRTGQPEYGFGFSPSSLPFPHRYAPQAICGRFQPGTQRWLPARHPVEWLEPGREGAFAIGLRGRVPRGESVFPLPLYTRVVEITGDGVRVLRGRGGRVVVVAREPTVVSGRLELDQAPRFEGAEERMPTVGPLLEATAPDGELPDEALGFAEELRVSDEPLLQRALAVRAFVQRRYRYDPSYLEDAAVAQWLRRVTRGRPNVHIAALHAGADDHHLGAGVCYELGVLACELMRRAGVPAAVSSGWTWEAGTVADPDHLWAMALLPSDVGPRWLPIDPSTTRDGRPLRVGRRPAGPWRADTPAQTTPPPEEAEDLDRPRSAPREQRRGRGGAPRGPRGPSGAAGRGQRQHRQRPAGSPRKRKRPPIGELMRVIRHLSELSGEPVDSDNLIARCRALLEDPGAAREVLEAFEASSRAEDDG